MAKINNDEGWLFAAAQHTSPAPASTNTINRRVHSRRPLDENCIAYTPEELAYRKRNLKRIAYVMGKIKGLLKAVPASVNQTLHSKIYLKFLIYHAMYCKECSHRDEWGIYIHTANYPEVRRKAELGLNKYQL